MPTNYVKFMRGSQALYDNLATKDRDTLYFVYENINDEYGKLYLGNKLISGASGESVSIADVADIILDANLSDGDVLTYDEAEGKWVNTPLTEIANLPSVMEGATAENNGTSGLVPMPEVGDQLKFLRGDGTWDTPVAELSPQDQQTITSLQSAVDTLIDTDTGKSIREVAAEELASQLIPANASESLDTLEEIAAWIQDHPDDASAMNQSITVLQTQVGNLDDAINRQDGLVDRVESLEDSIGTFTPVQAKYLDVGSAIAYLDNTIDDLNNTVAELNNRLRWHELGE